MHEKSFTKLEEWLNVTTNAVTAFPTWNNTLSSTSEEVKNFWPVGYSAINRINVVLKGIADNSTVLQQTVSTMYQAEGRFLRAVSYFYLVTLYGKKPYASDNGGSPGLPLRQGVMKTIDDVNENANLVRSTVAEVYNQVLNDLNFAETNLPLMYGAANDTNVVRAHRNAAIAFTTRVYLNMGKYAEVITEANKIVSQAAPFQSATGRLHRLEPNFVSVFRTPYTSSESIFSLPMTIQAAPARKTDLLCIRILNMN